MADYYNNQNSSLVLNANQKHSTFLGEKRIQNQQLAIQSLQKLKRDDQDDEFYETASLVSIGSGSSQYEDVAESEGDEHAYSSDGCSDEDIYKQIVFVEGVGQLDEKHNTFNYSLVIEQGSSKVWIDLMRAVSQASPSQCSIALKEIIRGLQLGLLDSDCVNGENDCYALALKHLFLLRRVLDIEAAKHQVQFSKQSFPSVGLHRLMVGEVLALLLGVGTGIGDVGAKADISIAIAKEELINRLVDIAFQHPHASTLHCCLIRCLEITARGRCQAIWASILGISSGDQCTSIVAKILAIVEQYGNEAQNQRPSVLSMSIKIASLLKQLHVVVWPHQSLLVQRLQSNVEWMQFISTEGTLDMLLLEQLVDSNTAKYQLKPVPTFQCAPLPINQHKLTWGQLLSQKEILNMVHSNVFALSK